MCLVCLFVCLFVFVCFLLFFFLLNCFLKRDEREREREREKETRERERGGNLHETQRSVTKCEFIWAWETNLTFCFFIKKFIIITVYYLISFFVCFFFPDIFPHLTVDSMKASISHDFGCYTFKSCLKKSSIRIGAREIGIFVLRKRNKLKKWEFQTEKKRKRKTGAQVFLASCADWLEKLR